MGVIVSLIILSVYPCILVLSYTMFQHPTRLILQTFFILPILLISSVICTVLGGIFKYLSQPILANKYRIYLLQKLYRIITEALWFAFEFWSCLRIVVSFENYDNDISSLNSIVLCNHNETLLDFIPLGSISDWMNRTDSSFAFVKKETYLMPILGWIEAVCPHGVSLNRNWDIDKIKIANLCLKFNQNIDYKLTSPWSWFLFPEGTRFTQNKLRDAKEFAKKRDLVVYDNLLQPRVKGFSYLTHNLYESLGAIIDITAIYYDAAPGIFTLMYKTRICKYIHLHLRVYRKDKNEIPNDINELNKWIRLRWTEKDNILNRMKKKEINHEILSRTPNESIGYYLFWTFIVNYIMVNYLYGIGYLSVTSLLILISSLFPIFIALVERSQKVNFD